PNKLPAIRGEFEEIDVALDYRAETVLVRRANANDSTANSMRIWYLPWKDQDSGGMSKADLTEKGSGIFLTSQLTGCRFTIQYHSADMTKATVVHLAGTYGRTADGSKKRDELEQQALATVPTGGRVRRYSIGNLAHKPWQLLPNDGTRLYYDGEKATILGVRGRDSIWRFFAQQYDMVGKASKDPSKKVKDL